jgi:prolyl oligopeptidase
MLRFLQPPIDAPTVERPLDDPRQWLEAVNGAAALDWVRDKNKEALALLGEPAEQSNYARILSILDSKEKIPYIGRVLNGMYYNFWQDDKHVHGVWRRCTLDEYRKESPAWESVLDLDALSKAEKVKWVWAGSVVLDEGPDVAVPPQRAAPSSSRRLL